MTRFCWCRRWKGWKAALTLGMALLASFSVAQQEESVDLESLPWSGERLLTSLSAHTVSPTIVADEYGIVA